MEEKVSNLQIIFSFREPSIISSVLFHEVL